MHTHTHNVEDLYPLNKCVFANAFCIADAVVEGLINKEVLTDLNM